MIKKAGIFIGLLFSIMGTQAQVSDADGMQHKSKPGKKMTKTERVEKQIDKRTKQLGLTPEQQHTWRLSMERYTARHEELKSRKNGPVNKEERRRISGEMRANQKQYDEEVLNLLDDAQRVKWAEIQKKEKQKREQRRAAKKATRDE
jgi:hypothetical protein